MLPYLAWKKKYTNKNIRLRILSATFLQSCRWQYSDFIIIIFSGKTRLDLSYELSAIHIK